MLRGWLATRSREMAGKAIKMAGNWRGNCEKAEKIAHEAKRAIFAHDNALLGGEGSVMAEEGQRGRRAGVCEREVGRRERRKA